MNNTRPKDIAQRNRDTWIAQQAASIKSGLRVLDVGAGGCPYRDLFKHCEYRSQDFVQLLPEQLSEGGYGEIDYVCDSSEIPVPNESFDVVLCTEVLEHVPAPIAVLAEIARVLKPGGIALITAPLCSYLHQEPYHFYGGFTPYFYIKNLRELGFARVSCEPNGGFFMHMRQEGLRMEALLRRGCLGKIRSERMVWWRRILTTGVWVLLVPQTRILLPLLSCSLDRNKWENYATVGYHVRGEKLNRFE